MQGETGPQTTGTPLVVELKDVQGWQEVRLPVPAKVEGVRLTLVTTYPGAKYEDTCLSDLRVYVEGDDPYRPEAEAAAYEKVRAFAFERKQAAARNDTTTKVAWAPRFEEDHLWTQPRAWARETPVQLLARFPDSDAHRAALAVAREAAALFQKVDLQAGASEAQTSWTRVFSTDDGSQQALARTALSIVNDEGLVEAAGLFHLDDASFIEDGFMQERLRESLEQAREDGAHANTACIDACTTRQEGMAYGCESECEDAPNVATAKAALEELERRFQSGEFVQGSATEPTALLRGLTRESGNREVHRTFRQSLIRYTGKKASAVLVSDDAGAGLSVHVLEWATVGGKERIASITAFRVTLSTLKVVRYRPAT